MSNLAEQTNDKLELVSRTSHICINIILTRITSVVATEATENRLFITTGIGLSKSLKYAIFQKEGVLDPFQLSLE